jgi:hypothetical protein
MTKTAKQLEFDTDKDGNVITNPVTGWTSASFAGMGVVLAMHYADTPLALETGKSKSLQFALTPQQCLELAERLTKLAKHLLAGESSSGKPAN